MKKIKKIIPILLFLVLMMASTLSVSAASIKLNKTSVSIGVKQSTTLKVIGTNKKVKWSTSSKSIATVSSTGKVEGKKVGTAIISAKVGKKTLKCKVTVKPGLNSKTIIVAKSDYAMLRLYGAKVKKFKSSNTKIATVSKTGKIVGKKKGKATITVTDTKNRKYTCKVSVESPVLNKTSIKLKVGKTYNLKLNGNTQTVKWSSSYKNIAAVNSKGKVTAKTKGQTTVSAKVGHKIFKCKVIVEAIPTPTLSPSPVPEKEQWTVSFETNGGSAVKSVIVKDGEKLVRPSNPVKNNYNFIGWYTDGSLQKGYDFEKRVRKNITLYAGWAETIEYAVTYTRGEWVELLALMIDMNLNTDMGSIEYHFSDTQESEYAVAIETAYAYGLLPDEILEDDVQDVPCFYPDKPATREFAAYTVAKALGLNDVSDESANWSDWNSVSYKNEALYVVSLDLMRLSGNAFCPSEPLNENDEKLIENGIYQILNSVSVSETDEADNSVYVEKVVKDELEDIKDYTVTDNGNGTYTVGIKSGINTADIKTGNVLLLPANDKYPAGIALKVTKVVSANNQKVFICTTPKMEEVYSVIDFSGQAVAITDQIEAADGFQVKYDPNGRVATGDNGPSTYAHINVGGSTALPGKLTFEVNKKKFSEFLELDGSIEVEIPDVTCIFDADVGLFSGISVNEFTFSVSEKVKIEETLTYKLAESGYELTNGAGNTRFVGGRIEIGRIPFAIGTTGLSLDFILYADISVKGTVSISYTITAQEGIQYKGGRNRIIKNFSDSLDFLEIKGSAYAKVGVAADICALEMFDLAGIAIDFGPAFDASFTPHVLATDTLFCSDVAIYATSSLTLDRETVLGKFLENVCHYTLEFELLKNDSANPLRKNLHIENCHRVAECTFGRGTLQGSVLSAKDSSVISGARIQVYDENGTLVRTTYTKSNGKYVIDNLEGGNYKISISANNYQRYDMDVTITKDITTYAETVKMVPRSSDIGTLEGRIIDAVSGSGISGASYTVRKGWNTTTGELILTGTFVSSSYTLELPNGNYTLTIEKEGYISNSVNVAVQVDTCVLKDVTLSPEDPESIDTGDVSNIRIVLTWGAYPYDLDSHLFGPEYDDPDSYFHTCYYDKTYYYYDYNADRDMMIANLDLDDTDSYGPETTTVYSVSDKGTYSFYVHDYSNKWDDYSTELSESDAKVQVYADNRLINTFNVPTGVVGNVWHVFDYDAESKVLTPINRFSSQTGLSALSVFEEEDSVAADGFLQMFANMPEKEQITEDDTLDMAEDADSANTADVYSDTEEDSGIEVFSDIQEDTEDTLEETEDNAEETADDPETDELFGDEVISDSSQIIFAEPEMSDGM